MYHFKECLPGDTVKKIKSILKKLNIKTDETEMQHSSVGTYSLTLNIKDSHFSTNGKGLTPELAQASAYAELMERLSNDVLWPRLNYKQICGFHCTPDEKLLSAEAILSEDNSFIKLYRKTMGDSIKGAIDFSDLHIYDKIQYGLTDHFVCIPYKNLLTDRDMYLPKCLYQHFYGTNGMCAGNTRDEALLQGISEIFERAAQRRLIASNPALPRIPDAVLRQYPEIYLRLEKINALGYQTIVADFSFGGELPGTIGVIYYKLNTGRYGIKIGCHPNMEIAIERALTEATQGQEISQCADRSEFRFNNDCADQLWNLHNLYRAGVGDYKYQIFTDNSNWCPESWSDEADISALLKKWTEHIRNMGFDILVRDNSYLGFPCFHIIIPGLSELDLPDEEEFRFINSRKYLSERINESIALLSQEELSMLSAILEHYKNEYFEGDVASYYFHIDSALIPGAQFGICCDLMIALCELQQEHYETACQYFESAIDCIQDPEILTMYKCLMLYVDAMACSIPEEAALKQLRILFTEESLKYVYTAIGNKNHLLSAFYPNVSAEEQINAITGFKEMLCELRRMQKEYYSE